MKRLIVVLAMVTMACATPTTSADDELPIATEFAPELGIDLATMTQTETGLYLQDVVVGSGREAIPGRPMIVNFTAWLSDGTQVDSGTDFEFVLGVDFIQGWNQGIRGMREGGRRKLVVPPSLGYGALGRSPDIPGGATLVFDIELLQVF